MEFAIAFNGLLIHPHRKAVGILSSFIKIRRAAAGTPDTK
jgi:hypothetical protein